MKKNKEKKVKHCLCIIGQAFNSNVEAHRQSELSQDAYCDGLHNLAKDHKSYKEKLYEKKSKMIAKAIKYIKKYQLPIKYGANDGIAYFSYMGEQISFHIFGGKKIKKYSGNRSHRRNSDVFPRRLMNYLQ